MSEQWHVAYYSMDGALKLIGLERDSRAEVEAELFDIRLADPGTRFLLVRRDVGNWVLADKDPNPRVARLSQTVRKLAGWAGHDIADLIEEGYLEEGDLS